MNIPKVHNLSTASQLSLLAIVILLGAVFFTVNSALQQQNGAGHASVKPYASISIRSTTHRFATSTNQFTLNTPSGVVAGDVLIAQVVVHKTTTTITPPSGWTLIRRDNTGTSTADALYSRIATGVDAKSYVWTFDAIEEASGGVVDLVNVDTTHPIDDSSGKYNYASSTMTANSVTPTTNADELLFFGAVDGTATITAPSGMTGHWTTSTTHTTSYMANQKLTSAGATGIRVGKSSTTNSNISQLVALKPSSIIVPPNSPSVSSPSPSVSIIPPGGNLLLNPSFENGTTSWNFVKIGSAAGTFATTTTTAKSGASSALITVTTPSNNSWDLQLKQGNLPIVNGQIYSVNFWAKASASRTIANVVQQIGSPNTTYSQKAFNLTTSWKLFSYTFTASGTSQSKAFLGFNVANTAGNVWIDNVSFAPSNINVSPSVPISSSPQPSSSPAPGSTLLDMTLSLHGIGTGGDSANPKSKGNLHPQRPTRQITVEIYDARNQLVITQQGSVTYASSSGKFKGTIDLGKKLNTGSYSIKIKTDQYLRALIPGIQTITAGKKNTMPPTTMVVGDINGDNKINIVDYSLLLGCYSDLTPATDCKGNNKVLSDLDDDGNVNQFDYNLFLRELTNVGGQ